MIGKARVVALGESAHEIGENSVNIHEFRAFGVLLFTASVSAARPIH